jgi:hypothetical protein
MSALSPLLPAAMVGTDRQVAASVPATGAVGKLLQELDAAVQGPAERLLRTAAVVAVCSEAGHKGSPRGDVVLDSAEPDRVPALVDTPSLEHVRWALREGPWRLQHLALRCLARAGWRLPPALLPLALEVGRRSAALRPAVVAVLGKRGSWLARQNADWRYAAGNAPSDASGDDLWAHGSLEHRLAWLKEQRLREPGTALDRLATDFASHAARERAEFVAILAHGLRADDEAFLVPLLTDRSKEVRQAALGLLVRLSDGAFAQRAAQRLDPLLRTERGLLRTRWTLEAPDAPDPAWERDAIELSRPKQESLGDRGWLLFQLVRQVPLVWWVKRTGMAPDELLAWAVKSDWSEALLRGWRDVLMHTADAAWCDALLDGWPWKGLTEDPARIVALLPLPRRERHWQKQLSGTGASLSAVAPQLLAACGADESVSPAFSRDLASAMRGALADPNIAYDYSLRSSLPELACVLHQDALGELAGLPRRHDETPAHAEVLHAVDRVIAARLAFHHLPTTHTP